MEESRARGGAEVRSPLRVAMVIQRFRPDFSGQGVQLEELSRALVRRGVEVTIFAAARSAGVEADESVGGYRIRRLRADVFAGAPLPRRLRSPVFAMRTAAALSTRDVDLIHVHGVNDALYTAWAIARLRRIPILFELTLMGADDPDRVRDSANLCSGLRYAIYRRMDGYVAISPRLAEAFRRVARPTDLVRTIPQGVDLSRYRPVVDRAALRRELGLPSDSPLVSFVGSLIERKGIDVLAAAWEKIAARLPRARLLLIGRDRFPDDRAAEDFLESHLGGLSASAAARVVRLGVRDDPQRFLAASDVFLFPSRQEGFGTAIIEGMACGLPCVTAEIPGITDFIFGAPAKGKDVVEIRGADGIVVPQNDAAALAETALTLIAAPDVARAVGAVARARAEERFAIDSVAEQYLSTYRELTGSHSAGERQPPQG